jgi:hypothetical protein
MRVFVLALVAAAGLTAVAATAQNPMGRQVTVCLDSAGHRHQAVCQRGTQSGQGYVCTCTGGLTAVTAPACAPGESPALAGAAASQAMKAALKSGTLNDVKVDGRRLCVQTRHGIG